MSVAERKQRRGRRFVIGTPYLFLRLQADSANIAKSRFLAAASHDLRQPLQALVLLQELLAKVVVGEKANKLIGRLDQTLGGMAGMLNALLDINQIEAGTIRARAGPLFSTRSHPEYAGRCR